MKMYNDESLKEEIVDVQFGRVEVGEKKIVSAWLYNDSSAILEDVKVNLEQIVSKEEVKILEQPKEMRPYAKAEVKFEWEPTLKIKAGLKIGVDIKALEVWG